MILAGKEKEILLRIQSGKENRILDLYFHPQKTQEAATEADGAEAEK